MQDNSSYDLIFIAEETVQDKDFTNFGFVYANYVFAMDKDENPMACSFSWLYCRDSVNFLIQTLCDQTNGFDIETYLLNQQGNCCVFDLSLLLPKVISSTEAEKKYPDWIKQSGRQDVFDEFCRFMGVVDYLNCHSTNSHLLLCVFEEKEE